jgi:hypothetical protein
MNAIVSPVYTTLQQVPQLHLNIPFDQLNKNIESWKRVIRGECSIDDLDRELGYVPEPEYQSPEENSVALFLCNSESWDESYAESTDDYSEFIGEDDESTHAGSRANSANRSIRSSRGAANVTPLAFSPPDARTIARAKSPRFRQLVQAGAAKPGRRYSQPALSASQPDAQPDAAQPSRRSSDGMPPGFRGNSG